MSEKNKKRTLTISSNLKKKIDFKSVTNQGKKSFSVNKKKFSRNERDFSKKFLNNKQNQEKNSLYLAKRLVK